MNVEYYLERLGEEARRSGFRLREYGTAGGFSLPMLERLGKREEAARIYISAGIHGDEPAGPMAILDLLRRRELPEAFHYTIYPLLNPRSLVAGTRESPEGLDLNRDYGAAPQSVEVRAHKESVPQLPYAVTLCLHEDYDGEGFYLFAHHRAEWGAGLPAQVLAAAGRYCGIDRRTVIDDMPAKEGLMQPPDSVFDGGRVDLPEAVWLYFNRFPQVTLTTETPSGIDLPARVAGQCAAVRCVLEAVKEADSGSGFEGGFNQGIGGSIGTD